MLAGTRTGAESIHQQSAQYSCANDKRILVVREEEPGLRIRAYRDVSAAIAISDHIYTHLAQLQREQTNVNPCSDE